MMRLSESKRERALILSSESIFAVFDGKGTVILQTVQYSKVGLFFRTIPKSHLKPINQK